MSHGHMTYFINKEYSIFLCILFFQVIASTSDKASPNQCFIKLHGDSGYKAPNIYAPGRDIFFFSDAPHLIKTIRNNLSTSGFGKNSKVLWVGLYTFIQNISFLEALNRSTSSYRFCLSSFSSIS